MSVPKYCLDIGKSRLKCSCSVPPPAFNDVVLPPIPTTDHTVDGPTHEITTDGPFTGNTDTSFDTSLDSKLLGTILGIIIILIVILIVIGSYCLRRRRGTEGELARGAVTLKPSPSNCSQKPLLQTSSEASGNPKLDKPQQPNGESEKIMENSQKANKINDASFNGGDLFIPMIDDDEEEDVNDDVVSKVVFNESSC